MATQTAANATYAAVNTAMGLCNDGDTLAIPAGTATWASTLTVSKAISIQGASKETTLLSGGSFFLLSPGSNKAQSISGIGFTHTGGSNTSMITIAGSDTGAYVLDQIRIHHCSFEGTTYNEGNGVRVNGWVECLIDHNYFLNVCDRAIFIVGDNDAAYAREIAAGTSHAVFIEDNTFEQTDISIEFMENIYHQSGGRSVVRYNTFTAPTYAYDYVPFDSHGNQGYWSPGGDLRGQPLIEIYNNTFEYVSTYRVMYFRSGSIIMHDNAFTEDSTSTQVVLDEAEAHETERFNPLRTVWPAQDQVNNSFFWNNTVNGTDPIVIEIEGGSPGAVFIQQDRDYFLHAPLAAGTGTDGKASYTGARNGGSTTAPTQTDTGNTIFTADVDNAYYPYTPYTYPHPLQGASSATPWIMMYG